MKLVDLQYLTELSDGDLEFRDEIIGNYIKQAPDYLKRIETALESNDAQELVQAAHKFNSSVRILGVKQLQELLTELEINNQVYIRDREAGKSACNKLREMSVQVERELEER